MESLQFIGPNYNFVWQKYTHGGTLNNICKNIDFEQEQYLLENRYDVPRTKVTEFTQMEQVPNSETFSFRVVNRSIWDKLQVVNL